jgi:hypothetical protein
MATCLKIKYFVYGHTTNKSPVNTRVMQAKKILVLVLLVTSASESGVSAFHESGFLIPFLVSSSDFTIGSIKCHHIGGAMANNNIGTNSKGQNGARSSLLST